MKRTRIYLVGYTIVCGEYEFSGDTILTTTLSEHSNPKAAIGFLVDNYFKDFYGEKACCKRSRSDVKSGYYLYNAGEVAVKKIHYKRITRAQRKVLQELNVA
jgi:hypothetical protein